MTNPVLCLSFLLMLLLMAACGGSSSAELTTAEYFEVVQRLATVGEEESALIERQLEERLEEASGEEAVSAYREFFRGAIPQLETLLADTRDLGFPDQVRAEHEAFVRAFEEVIRAFKEVEGRIGEADADTEEEVVGLFSEVVFDVAVELGDACFDLQGKAAAVGFEVDLQCDR